MEPMDPWLRSINSPDEAVVRLLCLPRAGGSAQDFFDWPQKISSKVHICSVQLPGRQERFVEPPIDRIEVLVGEIAILARELTDLPLVLFGDCMGALVGFEVMRELRRTGAHGPVSLIAASYPPPHHQRTGPVYHDAPEHMLREHLESIGGVSEELMSSFAEEGLEEEEFFELLIPILRADFAVYETYKYVPEPPLLSEIHVIGGAHDPYYCESVLEAWKHHTSGAFSLRLFEGSHVVVQRNPEVLAHVEQLALRHGRPSG
jgi:medium-chain acyl-[acyl-carrier-protein] hydrolase